MAKSIARSNAPKKRGAHVAKELHTITWQRRADVRWGAIVECAIHRLSEAAANPHGQRYAELLYGTRVGGRHGKDRTREKRSDGGINAITMMTVCVASCDLMTGFVARPVGGQWERKTYYELDGLAYGDQVAGARSFRRTLRAAEVLTETGLLRTNRMKYASPAGIRDAPGCKFVTEKLWRILGLWAAIKRERRRRRAEADKAKIDQLLTNISGGNLQRAKRRQARDLDASGAAEIPFKWMPAALASADPASVNHGPAPPPAAHPAEVAAAHIANIKALLGLTDNRD